MTRLYRAASFEEAARAALVFAIRNRDMVQK